MALLLERFTLAFIPLFVALDPIGLAGLFLGMTADLDEAERRRIARQATLTGAVVALGFLLLGKLIFRALDITIHDFQLAGGLILFILAVRGLLDLDRPGAGIGEHFGVVPLGVPLIAGPATLTALLVAVEQAGAAVTLAALSANLLLVVLTLRHVRFLVVVLGRPGLMALSKLISLLLAAYAVHMVRIGWQGLM